MVTGRDAELLSGAQDDAKELRSELAKARQRYAWDQPCNYTQCMMERFYL